MTLSGGCGGGRRFCWGDLKERTHLGDLVLDGRKVLSWIFKKWVGGIMDWIDICQDKDRWRTVVNAVMNLRVL
jgi:hypothetical protein